MTSIAPHITAFLRERLPLQRGASPHTCESYAYTFQLLFEFASKQHKVTPSKLYLEQIDAVLVMDFLAHIEATRDNSARTRNARLAAIKSFMRFVEHRVPSVLEQSLSLKWRRSYLRADPMEKIEAIEAVTAGSPARSVHRPR